MSQRDAPSTALLSHQGRAVLVRRFRARVVAGPRAGLEVLSDSDSLTIGTDRSCQLQLEDRTASRYHCRLRATERGLELRDLGSKNGTLANGVGVTRGAIGSGTRLELGRSAVVIDILEDEIESPLSSADRFGELCGGSDAMRQLFARLEQFAATDATVLITGETGTGKELVAESLHAAGRRRDRPFQVVDCGALPSRLVASELFGHKAGAFTGATVERHGAFHHASGGTVFLDEIGELPLELQPSLLRVLESRTIQQIGASEPQRVDVRVIAATHRELEAEVNGGRFRADLFYRLDVLRVHVPPLRERTGDVELLARHFWTELVGSRGPMPEDLLAALGRRTWRGNVRELRNAVERAALLGWRAAIDEPGAGGDASPVSYRAARARMLEEWERDFVEELLARHGGNVSAAARAAQMSRSHLRSLLARTGAAGRTGGPDQSA